MMGTEMMNKEIVVTLMYSRASQQILFVEAGKCFVDLIVGFLALPIGCAIKLLSENALVTSKTVGGIANVFKSLQRLEAGEALTDPKPALADGEMVLWRDGDLDPLCVAPQAFFTCGASSHCSFVSPRYGTKCPRHQKKMTTQCKVMDCASEPVVKQHGYVKSNSSRYFVTDNLEIFPSSESLPLLQKLNVENMSSLDSIDLHVGTDELLQLLRASLTSANVLTQVFGKSLRDTPRAAEPFSQPNTKRDPAPDDVAVKESIEIARDWGRGLHSALKEVQDTAFHSSLVHYVKEREHRIGSALRDLGSGEVRGTKTQQVMPKPCKEMLMLEKQVDKVMARLCHLVSGGPSLDCKVKPSPVKPPWTMYQPSSRIRPPSAP